MLAAVVFLYSLSLYLYGTQNTNNAFQVICTSFHPQNQHVSTNRFTFSSLP